MEDSRIVLKNPFRKKEMQSFEVLIGSGLVTTESLQPFNKH